MIEKHCMNLRLCFLLPFIKQIVFISRSLRQSYGDDAVGYVQLRRDAKLCTVKCKICPEHKVRMKPYSATIVVDEENDVIVSVQCHDCAASQGGCKHAVAFIMWVHRRSEEPSCTSVECYWKKSRLAKVGTTLKFVTAKELSKGDPRSYLPDPRVLSGFLEEGKKRKLRNVQLMKYQPDYTRDDVELSSMHQLCLLYQEQDCETFLVKAGSLITENTIVKIEKLTRDQSQNKLWFELRYGRITASRAHDVSKCKTPDGSLIAQIMGGKLPDTPAMKRGRKLEDAVRKIIEVKLGVKLRQCGLIISKEYLMIAGSPDGICDEFVIEIKCPTRSYTYKNYVRDKKLTQKYYAQVQLQMFLSGKKQCYFCVADSNFETTEKVEIICVNVDIEYVHNILIILSGFWKANVYPLLHASVK